MSIKQILMERDGMSAEEAQDLINEAREELTYLSAAGEMDEAYHICETYFGLEPDYIFELI